MFREYCSPLDYLYAILKLSISRILGGLHSSRVGEEYPKGRWGSNTPMLGEVHFISRLTPPHPQEGAGKHYSYDRCRYLINAVSFMKALITPEALKPWERKAAARSSAVAVS